MTALISRPYVHPSDLDRLIKFSEKAAGVRWPRMSYMKPGDIVWMQPGFESSANIQLWFAGDDLIAYACFEPPLVFSFDIQPGLSDHDHVGDKILKWAEGKWRD